MEIQYLVNAGLYLSGKRCGLLIDGIHHGETVGLSAMPQGLFRDLIEKNGEYQNLRGLLFTHMHADHYDADLVERMLMKDIRFSLWGPDISRHNLDWFCATPHGACMDIGDFRCYTYRTKHSGEPYKDCEHASLLIREKYGQDNVFVSGDAVFEPELAEVILKDAGQVEKAFINIYHVIEDSSRDFLQALSPKRVLLYHVPFPEDDHFGQLKLIANTLRFKPLPGREIERPEHMSWIR